MSAAERASAILILSANNVKSPKLGDVARLLILRRSVLQDPSGTLFIRDELSSVYAARSVAVTW